jgi:hypothetical protein
MPHSTRKAPHTKKPAKLSHRPNVRNFHPLSNLPGNDLPPGPPSSPNSWRAHEIILIKWQLSRAASPVQPSIDPTASGVYSYSTLMNDPQNNDYLNHIQNFAMAAASGSLSLKPDALHTTASGTGPCEFVVWYPCYVVFLLEYGYWEFQRGLGKKALNTGYPQTTATYTDLNHVLGANVSPSVGNNQCQAAYFSAASTPGAYSVMPFNLFFEYLDIGTVSPFIQDDFDPAIKNDGHTPPGINIKKRAR